MVVTGIRRIARRGTVTTVQGSELTIAGEQGSLVIDEQQQEEEASVVCCDIPTANATVFVIDTVLMPYDQAAGPAVPVRDRRGDRPGAPPTFGGARSAHPVRAGAGCGARAPPPKGVSAREPV